jgi:hypothetical protein
MTSGVSKIDYHQLGINSKFDTHNSVKLLTQFKENLIVITIILGPPCPIIMSAMSQNCHGKNSVISLKKQIRPNQVAGSWQGTLHGQ